MVDVKGFVVVGMRFGQFLIRVYGELAGKWGLEVLSSEKGRRLQIRSGALIWDF